MDIGYIGLGSMGGSLAERLVLSCPLLVHDRDRDAVDRLVANGATSAASAADLASRSDVIFLCLPTSTHVRDVLFGDHGIASYFRPGTIVIDQTTGDPSATRSMAGDLIACGSELVDAPVSGGPRGASAGTIAIMVGASEVQFAKLQPILELISPNVFHAGDVGSGHTIKLVNNLVSTATRLLTFEAMSLADKNGVRPDVAFRILMASGARNAYLERIFGPYVLEGDLAAGYTLGLAHKDVRIACELGLESGVPMFFGNLTRELYQMYVNELGADAKVDTAALVVDRLAGTEVIPENHHAQGATTIRRAT